MAANSRTSVETLQLGPFIVPRVWTGLWQLSSSAWGSPSVSQIRQGMKRHVERGYTSFGYSCSLCVLSFTHLREADHYGSAEIIFGQFKGSLSDASCVIGATKWCVFKNISPTREVVEAAVRERLARMQTQRIDLLQFHWQMYENKGYLTALQELEQLRHEGLIAAIGLCNFDSIRTDEICTQLGPGVIVSNQVQFSLIDTRPLHGMSDVCMRHQLKLLTYGTLCGGFLSDQWFHQPEPDAYTANLTPSQRKARVLSLSNGKAVPLISEQYLDMIKAWGNWKLFQKLLALLRVIGDRHGGRSIANIATRWVLDHEFVGAVIIGARLGLSEHSDDNLKVFGWSLTDGDREEIESILSLSKGRKIITTIGDCGAEYR